MIPTREQLEQITAAREGTFDQTPFPLLVLAIAVQQKSAVLDMRRAPIEKRIVFDTGAPVECISNVATETLGRFMVSIGKISDSDYHATLSAAASRGVAFEDVLIERGVVTPSDLYKILQQNLARKLLDGFAWTTGSYRLSYDMPPVESPLRVKVPQLLFTGIVKLLDQEIVERDVADLADGWIVRSKDPLFPPDEIRFSADQSKLLAMLERPRKMSDLGAVSGLADDDLMRVIHAFSQLGLIEKTAAPVVASAPFLELDLPPEPAPTIAAPPPEPEKPAPSIVEPPPAREDLMRVYLSFKRKDAFDFFGLSEEAMIGEIVRTYLRFSERFSPWRFADDEALREKAQELFLAAARAYTELADPDRKSALIEKRRRVREAPKKVSLESSASGKMGLLDPEELYRKGSELFAEGKKREALRSFELASDIDPQNGIYASEVAYTRFHLMSFTGAQALNSLKQVMRFDPTCGLAYLYAGKIHQNLNNHLEAAGYLQKASKMMGNDRRVVEALRTLKR